MATQQIVSPVVQQRKSAVVSFPAVPQEITQFKLVALMSLQKRTRELDSEMADAEASISCRMGGGARVEDGVFSACLKITERRPVAWKAVVERELGEDYARRLLAATRPDKFSTLVIGV